VGPWGYADLLEAIKDPKHERHVELTEWIGDDFDPDDDEAEALTAQVALLAKTWSRTRRRFGPIKGDCALEEVIRPVASGPYQGCGSGRYGLRPIAFP
jgi:hypothetical protein